MTPIEYGILLVGLAICVLIYYTVKAPNTYLAQLAKRIPLLTEYFLAVGVYYTYVIFRATIDGMKRDATYKIIDRGWLLPNEKLNTLYDQCPAFVNSLYFPWQKNVMAGTDVKSETKPSSDNWTAVNYLSTLLFQAWEDFLTSVEIDQTGDYVWITNYLQWTQSKTLEAVWKTMCVNYSNRTIAFGNYLFRQNTRPKNAAELKALAHALVQTDEYHGIKKM